MTFPERPIFCDLPEWLIMTPAEREKYSRLHMQRLKEYGEQCAKKLAELYSVPLN